jgi:hypothetical protein
MKLRGLLALAIFIGFSVGFWLYSVGRTMRETVSFDSAALCFGLLLGVILPSVAVLPLLLARTVWPKLKLWTPPWAFVALGLALLVGSVLAEWWILRDERRFSDEVSKASLNSPYSRPRAWPNGTSTLVFIPGKGIHATD